MATQSEINAALGLPPGINPDGSWNAQDYMARRVAGQVDTQAQVDAARAANPYSAQNMAKVDVTRQGQYVTDPTTGNPVALSAYARIDGYVDSIDLSKCEFEKQCALIAVKELIETTDYYYWTEVKKEIEKL